MELCSRRDCTRNLKEFNKIMNIVVVNGKPTSGKDTVVQMCIDYLDNHSGQISTVDVVKTVYRTFG